MSGRGIRIPTAREPRRPGRRVSLQTASEAPAPGHAASRPKPSGTRSPEHGPQTATAASSCPWPKATTWRPEAGAGTPRALKARAPGKDLTWDPATSTPSPGPGGGGHLTSNGDRQRGLPREPPARVLRGGAVWRAFGREGAAACGARSTVQAGNGFGGSAGKKRRRRFVCQKATRLARHGDGVHFLQRHE